MITNPSLLVVDDEEIYCEGCRRIFARQGFSVEESHDADQGLNLATERDYAAILLDVRMPTMDGMEFLQHLRRKKPDVPVILMTGYPSVSNAASALRLGASDYVTKPFTPEEITVAVRNLLGNGKSCGGTDEASGWTASTSDVLFHDHAWLQQGASGTVRVGAQMPSSAVSSVQQWRMPRIGDVVAQGLPLVGWIGEDEIQRTVPSPISGVVVAVNGALPTGANVWEKPIDENWIAEIAPTGLEDETAACSPRRLILATSGTSSDKATRLSRLGCQVRLVNDLSQMRSQVSDLACGVVVVDDAALQSSGLELVDWLRKESPATRTIVLASSGGVRESDYRARRIFYYTVDPVSDGELVDVLTSLFVSPALKRAKTGLVAKEERPIRSIQITNRQRTRVTLLASDGRLRRDTGLGHLIEKKLLDRLFPKETTLGEPRSKADAVVKAAAACDRLFVLTFADMGRLPGCLSVDRKRQITGEMLGSAENVTPLVVQPDASENGLDLLDFRTTEALAEQIVRQMASA